MNVRQPPPHIWRVLLQLDMLSRVTFWDDFYRSFTERRAYEQLLLRNLVGSVAERYAVHTNKSMCLCSLRYVGFVEDSSDSVEEELVTMQEVHPRYCAAVPNNRPMGSSLQVLKSTS